MSHGVTMRVAIITESFPPDVNGVAHCVLRIAELLAAGAKSLVITPVRLNQERRRKNDRLDARELCLRLSRYVDGHTRELPTIRIPSAQEQQRRELGRQREFWKRELRRIENHGRALRIEHDERRVRLGGTAKAGRVTPRLLRPL